MNRFLTTCIRSLPAAIFLWAITAASAALPAAVRAQDVDASSPPPAASTERSADPPDVVDFNRDIQPILQAHCHRCHGAERFSGGLRLDQAKLAAMGGHSGRTVVGGTLETNELYRRVSASERSYRMPKNSPALPAEQIALIKRWVEAGAIWPGDVGQSKTVDPFYNRWMAAAAALADRYTSELAYLYPYAIAFLVLQLLLWFVVRSKLAFQNARPWAMRWRWWSSRCAAVRYREVVLVWLLLLGSLGTALLRGHGLRLARDVDRLSTLASSQTSLGRADPIFGWPPRPVRPDHPKQIAGVYYRGNCERNPELFNNGNYLTATFRVSLCDSEHRELRYGDPYPQDGLFVRIDLERAPGTADALFSEDMMKSVFFTHHYYEESGHEALKDDHPTKLETVETGQRWLAYVPVLPLDNSGHATGLIYVYSGRITDGRVSGSVHYGVQYELAIEDGNLSEESDLWMNAFANPAFDPPHQPDKLPWTEWFDYRPLTTITEKNTTDPKLLGVEEYVRKGLLKPEALQPPPAQAPRADDAAPPPAQDEHQAEDAEFQEETSGDEKELPRKSSSGEPD